MTKKDYLPVGSVVLLKNAKRKVVIIGYSIVEEKKTKIWDYLGCPYPIGVISSDENLLFNKEDIEDIYFIGYHDKEGNDFYKELEDNMKRIKIDGIN